MGLSDRIQRRAARESEPVSPATAPAAPGSSPTVASAPPVPSAVPVPSSAIPRSALPVSALPRHRQRQVYDPLADVRRRAHEALLELLGPRLYETASSDDELERQVREALPEV